jgi:hypothetical protein
MKRTSSHINKQLNLSEDQKTKVIDAWKEDEKSFL